MYLCFLQGASSISVLREGVNTAECTYSKTHSGFKNSSWLNWEVETLQGTDNGHDESLRSRSFFLHIYPKACWPRAFVQALSRPLPCLWPAAPGGESANAAKRAKRPEQSQRRRFLRSKENLVANPNPNQVSFLTNHLSAHQLSSVGSSGLDALVVHHR